jgi:hypothetical protein
MFMKKIPKAEEKPFMSSSIIFPEQKAVVEMGGSGRINASPN